jgi:hypothetical protein
LALCEELGSKDFNMGCHGTLGSSQSLQQNRVGVIDPVAEQMNHSTPPTDRKLDGSDHFDAESLPCRKRLGRSADHIVIGDGDRMEANLGCFLHDMTRRKAAVRPGGV